MFNFGLIEVMANSVVSALILLLIGFSIRCRFCFDASKMEYSKLLRATENVVLFIEILSVFLVPFLLFYFEYPIERIPLTFTLSRLPEYVISQLAALLGLAIGDEIGAILNNATRKKLNNESIP